MNNYNFFDTFDETFLGTQIPNYNINDNLNTNMNVNANNTQSNSLFGPYEGYTNGNMFRNLYEQYKNYKPTVLSPKSEQEEALLNLNQMQFAMHDLNLFLDVFPNNNNMMNQFVAFRNSYNRLLEEYESKYGAININSQYLNNTPFGWVQQTWPWDRRSI